MLSLSSALACGDGTRGVVLRLRPLAVAGSTPVPDSSGGGGGASGSSPTCDAPDDGSIAEFEADGTLENDVCSPLVAEIQGQVGYGPGNTGQAWQFRSSATDGQDPDYVSVSGAAEQPLLGAGEGVTVDAWVQQTGFNDYAGSDRFIFHTESDGSWIAAGQVTIYLHENGRTYFMIATGDADVQGTDYDVCVFGNTPLTLQRWYRVTGTYDGVLLRCYLDGVLLDEKPLLMLGTAPMGTLSVGRSYPGDVDALRLFERALAPEEVAIPWP